MDLPTEENQEQEGEKAALEINILSTLRDDGTAEKIHSGPIQPELTSRWIEIPRHS